MSLLHVSRRLATDSVINHSSIRTFATSSNLYSPSTHKVVLDNRTLYIDRTLAEALGWKPEKGHDAGIQLSLSGWGPTYFTITPVGTDSDRLARAVVESSNNPNVKQVLEYLKDR
ncbi:hypothetical protein H2248_003289 [Termitomyces sp. 'cryptogamus']|nr:hypothetical protein H2248_003289 [Termitomyces sp. 'cryptogamus']